MSSNWQTETLCVVSTSHMPQELAEQLAIGEFQGRCPLPFTYWEREYGFLIYTDQAQIPEPIQPIVAAALAAGFDWIMFDYDGDVKEEFQVWEW